MDSLLAGLVAEYNKSPIHRVHSLRELVQVFLLPVHATKWGAQITRPSEMNLFILASQISSTLVESNTNIQFPVKQAQYIS